MSQSWFHPALGATCSCCFSWIQSRSASYMLLVNAVSYTHLRAHETRHDLVCRLLLEKKVVLFCTNFFMATEWKFGIFCMSAKHECKKVPNIHKGAIKMSAKCYFYFWKIIYFFMEQLFCTDFIAQDFSTYDLVKGTYG